jgi:hypothetical protein
MKPVKQAIIKLGHKIDYLIETLPWFEPLMLLFIFLITVNTVLLIAIIIRSR